MLLFEISNDIVPVLVWISVSFTFFAIHLASIVLKSHVMYRSNRQGDKLHTFQRNKSRFDDIPAFINDTNRFITAMIKRKEAPEDDLDDISSIMDEKLKRNRGGKQWRTTQFSPLLKGIALFC